MDSCTGKLFEFRTVVKLLSQSWLNENKAKVEFKNKNN